MKQEYICKICGDKFTLEIFDAWDTFIKYKNIEICLSCCLENDPNE